MRRAELRTVHGDAATAERIAAALRPDNTDQMRTTVDGDAVRTTVERETTSGLRATVDDYVVNLQVAAQLSDDAPSDTGTQADTQTQ